MPEQTRVGDNGKVDVDAHGCPACPHTAVGPCSTGSDNVRTNGQPSARTEDTGEHVPCCNIMKWTATKGSGSVFINGRGAHRKGDDQAHCGGSGKSIEGSPDVFAGD